MTRALVGVVFAWFLGWGIELRADAPAARLLLPRPQSDEKTIIRAVPPDPFLDDPAPSARLGPISGDRIGTGPANATADELYNWGARPNRRSDLDLPRPPNRDANRDWDRPLSRDRLTSNDRDRDRGRDPWYDSDRNAGRGSRLREPVGGSPTVFERAGQGIGNWLDDRRRDAQDGIDNWDRDRNRDRVALRSDCAFEDMMAFSSNPFLAEDPRSMTEIRPLFLWQTVPESQSMFLGGNATFFGLQGRVAFTERFSLVLHKLGGQTFGVGAGSILDSSVGFSEIWLGPKFVFWRDPEAQVIASAGMIFQLPVGSGGVYQDTGGLSLVPYLTMGRRIGQTGIGTMYLANVVGYSFGTSDQRSDYLYDTFHLSLDAGDAHWVHPFIEMSWFHYTSNGAARPTFNFEARDLANIGAPVRNRDFLSIAPGVRFRVNDAVQLGITTEFPLLGTRDLHQFRLGFDLIWRY